MPIVLRSVKGSRLTLAELDGNFTFVDGRITELEDNPAEARSISVIEQIGNSLIITYTDDTQDGPFPLGDIQLTFRGEWATSTIYLKYEIITFNGTVYMIGFNHESDDTEFDPAANDGEGHQYYNLLLEFPGHVIPTGGLTDAVLTKISGTNFDMAWLARGVPPDGELGDTLVKLSIDEGDYAWQPRGSLIAAPVVELTDHVVSIDSTDYANKFFDCTNDLGCQVHILSSDLSGLAIGDTMEFLQRGAEAVVLLEGEDVTIIPINGYDPVTRQLGAVMQAKCIAEDVWAVWGFLGTLDSDFNTDSDSDSA